MSAENDTRLTPRQRLNRGLANTAVGPVDVTRGLVGLGVHSAQSGASSLRRRYREGQLARDLRNAQEALVQELAAAQDVVSGLPEALQQARRSRRRGPRPWVLVGAATVVVAGGAVAFSIVRRSRQQEPSQLPPSVEVEPRI
ncbi:cell wall synthesis protein CwsA [Mycobacterium cookii]|uniref:Cell wall synthesis protein CwsA n=1 Tax=Mycobacterium cookii TaxID=1775 RepID=A0A7I7KYU6_9MYCO|nr:cell wall synthesis protein CwsA [Mycobacterium cookii]MCV7333336.1 cell wall synthesis protein CwsA [Mycobacterium cookii]BBX47123.1 cell wall synthesis protein CwsA [Mycobacterium cookii]